MAYDLGKLTKERKPRIKRAISIRLKRPFAIEHERKLRAIYGLIISFWREQMKAFLLSDGLTTDALPAPDRLLGVNTSKMVERVRERLVLWLAALSAFERKQWVAQVKRSTGIDIDNMAAAMDDDPDVLAALLWAAALAIDLDAQIRQRLTAAVLDGRAKNLVTREVKEIVAEVFKKAESRADFIAHDQTQKIASKIVEKQQLDAGVTKYVWNHSFQRNPRRHHVERQGNVYEWAKPPRDGHPGHAYNCRCTAAAYLEVA